MMKIMSKMNLLTVLALRRPWHGAVAEGDSINC